MSSTSHPATPAAALNGAARLEFIETTARLCHLVGLPQSTGRIYGLLYLSTAPLSLDDIAAALAISKASASTGTRQLVAVHAIRQVWIPGERRDHYEAQADLREVLRANYEGFFKPKLEKSQRKLDTLIAALDADLKSGAIDKDQHAFCRERFARIASLQGRLQKVLPIAEKFL